MLNCLHCTCWEWKLRLERFAFFLLSCFAVRRVNWNIIKCRYLSFCLWPPGSPEDPLLYSKLVTASSAAIIIDAGKWFLIHIVILLIKNVDYLLFIFLHFKKKSPPSWVVLENTSFLGKLFLKCLFGTYSNTHFGQWCKKSFPIENNTHIVSSFHLWLSCWNSERSIWVKSFCSFSRCNKTLKCQYPCRTLTLKFNH